MLNDTRGDAQKSPIHWRNTEAIVLSGTHQGVSPPIIVRHDHAREHQAKTWQNIV